MVVMQQLPNTALPIRDFIFTAESPVLLDSLRDQLEALRNCLQSQDLVHGDLREDNVYVSVHDNSVQLRVLDFDWAGRAGEARYSSFLTPAAPRAPSLGINRPDNEFITTAHDGEMIGLLVAQLEQKL